MTYPISENQKEKNTKKDKRVKFYKNFHRIIGVAFEKKNKCIQILEKKKIWGMPCNVDTF